MRSRYELMEFSEQRDSKDRFFPDVMTLPTHKFRFTEPPKEHTITSVDKTRFDVRMFREYEMAELDDIVRFVNRTPLLEDTEIGERFLLPSKENIERFYNENFA